MAGLMDILNGVAQVPEAIGGGALDILIGDRTNVTPGEQAKRAIQALLLGGDQGQNLLALQARNAQADRGNQQIVGSPEFQGAVATLMHQGVPGDQAYDRIARVYGVGGYAPNYSQTVPIDAAADRSGLPSPSIQQSRVPLLPPPTAQAQVKSAVAQEQLRGIARPGAEGAYSLAQLAKINPDLATQDQLLKDALGKYQEPGLNQTTVTFNDGKLAATVQPLGKNDVFFPATDAGRQRAIIAADAYNQLHKQIGSAQRMVPVIDPRGGYGLREDPSEEAAAFETVQGKTRGMETPIGGTPSAPASAAQLGAPAAPGMPASVAPLTPSAGSLPGSRLGMTPAQIAADDAQRKAAAKDTATKRDTLAKAAAEAEGNKAMANSAIDMIDALGPAAQLQPDQFDASVGGYLGNALYDFSQRFRAHTPNVEGNTALSTYDGAVKAITVPLFRSIGDKGFRNFEAIKASAQGVVPGAQDTEPVRVAKIAALRGIFTAMNDVPNGDDKAAAAVMKQQMDAYTQRLAGGAPQAAPNAQPTPAGIDPDLAAVIARRRGGR